MAIGSGAEIGVEFRTGTKDINYPWVVDGVQHQLMHGDSKVVYICGRPSNLYSRFEWECHKGCCVSKPDPNDEITDEIPIVGLRINGADGKSYLVQKGSEQ